MTIDLTGGLSEDLEFVFASQPDEPEMHESVNAWIWDEGVDFALPRTGIEAIGNQWDTHGMQLNLAFEALVFGLPRLQLAAPAGELLWSTTFRFHALRELPVRFA